MEGITKDQINHLIKLQEIEAEAMRVEAVLEEIPKKLETLDNSVQEVEQSIEEKESALNELKKEYKSSEMDLEENQLLIRKSNEKLVAVKTNKEYQAILREMEEIRKRNSQIEDKMLACLDRIEEEEKTNEVKKDEFLKLKERISGEKAVIQKEEAAETDKLTQLEKHKNEIAENVDPLLLKRYNAISGQLKSTAIAGVKDAVCLGCYMNIPPQMYNELHRSDTLKYCPHCNRMIYRQETN